MILKYIFYTNVIVAKINISVFSILHKRCFLWNFTVFKFKTNFLVYIFTVYNQYRTLSIRYSYFYNHILLKMNFFACPLQYG